MEDGSLGITLDNGFLTNRFFVPVLFPKQHQLGPKHFAIYGDLQQYPKHGFGKGGADDPADSVASAITWPGCLFMYTKWDLYISAGDTSDPFSSSGYTPIDERAGRAAYDSQISSGNENDLRGNPAHRIPSQMGRIRFRRGICSRPELSNTRPEVYVIGCRNPFRFSVDEANGWVYWGEVGPGRLDR